jgi:hypothetical protein
MALPALLALLAFRQGGMVEWFIAAVLKTKKVARRELLTYERMRTEASEKLPKRTSICQYAVNASSAEIAQSGHAIVVQDSSVTLAKD